MKYIHVFSQFSVLLYCNHYFISALALGPKPKDIYSTLKPEPNWKLLPQLGILAVWKSGVSGKFTCWLEP